MSLLLPSVGGLGVREEVHRLLYGTVAVADSTAVAMSLSTFGVQTLLPGIVGAVLYALEGAANLRQGTIGNEQAAPQSPPYESRGEGKDHPRGGA